MNINNNATKFKRELLVHTAKHFFENNDHRELDRIPLTMIPKSSQSKRCCIYKERSLIKYRLMHLLGYAPCDETDELLSLEHYAKSNSKNKLSTFSTLDIACKSCVKTKYVVTNTCQGCLARPCQSNCPKNAITFIGGKAYIDSDKCINCGKCEKECIYHAITHVPVPCIESCPVNAIDRNPDGVIEIDDSKCIKCGRCVVSCPFAAILAKSDILEVIKHLKSKEEVVAIIAPSIIGQFSKGVEELYQSLHLLGFSDIFQAATGADITISNETKELIDHNGNLLTSSCCPSYVELVEKHIPTLKPNLSTSLSPMIYTAKIIKEKYPNSTVVFIGPCIAKKREAEESDLVDNVITFEELGAMFIAKKIDVITVSGKKTTESPSMMAQGFAQSGGVLSAISKELARKKIENIDAVVINGLDKKNILKLKAYGNKKISSDFLEVMACEGGCIGGPFNITSSKMASSRIRKIIEADRMSSKDI